MAPKHYQKLLHDNSGPLQLRDYLAIDRTLLANERSLLAYVRTSITLFIAGISLLKFFDSLFTTVLGQALLAGALLVFIQGFRRFRQTEKIFQQELEATDHPGLALRFRHLAQQLVRVFYH